MTSPTPTRHGQISLPRVVRAVSATLVVLILGAKIILTPENLGFWSGTAWMYHPALLLLAGAIGAATWTTSTRPSVRRTAWAASALAVIAAITYAGLVTLWWVSWATYEW